MISNLGKTLNGFRDSSSLNEPLLGASLFEPIVGELSDDSLVLSLDFENTSDPLKDSSPSENSGELRNGAKINTSRTSGKTAIFDGKDDFIHINNSRDINLGTHAQRTVLLWFKVNNKNLRSKQVLYEEGGITRGLNIYLNKGKLYAGGWNQPETESSWRGTFLSTEAISSNTWHHVTVVLDAESGEKSVQDAGFIAYLDGKKFGEGQGSQLWSHSDAIGLGAINGSTKFHDGNTSGTGTGSFNGQIDAVQVYNQALSAQETAQIAESKKDEIENGLVRQLKFDETSRTQSKDSSPFGKDNLGELRNGAKFITSQFENLSPEVMNFDGIDDYVHVHSSKDINLGTHAKRTISLWFNLNNKNSSHKQVLYEEGGTARGLNIYIDNGQLYVGGWNQPDSESGWKGTFLSTDAIASGTWHHVALVLEAEAGKKTVQSESFSAYLDGVQFGEGNGSQLWSHAGNIGVGGINGSTKFHDGDASSVGTLGFAGSVDDVRIYNRGLTSSEITRLANHSLTNTVQPQIGTNLMGLVHWSTQLPFLNQFKIARPWFPQNDNRWNTREFDQLDLDDNGWVKSLPAPEAPEEYTFVGTQLFRHIDGRYPGGRYVVLYEGEGTIEYSFDAQKDRAASSPGRDVIDVTPSNAGIYLKITETDPSETGEYIRNIHVIPEEYEETYTTEVFNPAFLEKVEPFGVFRFMDWMKTNGSEQTDWDSRPTLDTATFNNIGAPVEIMVELANRTNVDPWFNMPHQATDEYITNFAQYVKTHLNPDLTVYVEYSNEVWNYDFPQNQWVAQQGQKAWTDANKGYTRNTIDWFSQRTTEITQIWDDVFGTSKDRVVGVMGAQAAYLYTAERALEYSWAPEAKSHEDYGIDAIAIAPYFGRYLGHPRNEEEVESWTTSPDGGFNNLFDELTAGGVLSNGPQGGALQESYKNMQAYADLAEQENLELLAYEGGQHLVGFGGVENNQALANLFIEANRDPRMEEVYRQYINKWFELGGSSFVHYTDISRSDKWGSYGSLESVYQDSSPKYDALLSFLDGANNI